MNGRGWLAGVAALGLIAGTPGVPDAKVTARTKAVKAKRKPVRRVAARVRVRPALAAAALSTPLPFAPASPPGRPAVYRWLDDAGAMTAAVGDTRPDLSFRDGDAVRYAWRLGDGATVIAEPMGPGDTRFYFYDVDMTAPFLVRDRIYSFGFERGALAAVFDADARAVTAVAWQERVGGDLYARGRQLWFAAQTPQRATPAPVVNLWVGGGWGGGYHWDDRSDGRWRADRTDAERDRRRARAERYRREHVARLDRDRRASGGERDGHAPGGWAGPVRDGEGRASSGNEGERTRPARPFMLPAADTPVPVADAATPADRPRRDRERRREAAPPVMVAPAETAPTPVAFAPAEPSRDADEPRREREGRREREPRPSVEPTVQAPVQSEAAPAEPPVRTEPERPAPAERERPTQARERVTDTDTPQPTP